MGRRPPVLEERLVEALQMVAPGTKLRDAIDNIVRAKTGALLVFADEKDIRPMISGGIDIDVELAPMILYELAKMDGAILLDSAGNHIIHANVQLMPDASIESQETGTRHRTAERVAKQIGALCISISAARDVVTIYIGEIRYIMEQIRVILDKANQALQTLEKFKSRLNQVSTSLAALEFEDAVTLYDVLSVLQRSEMVLVIGQEIERYIIELGDEGRLVELQLEELMVDVREDREAVLADYLPELTPEKLTQARLNLGSLRSEELLSLSRLSQILGYEPDTNTFEKHVSPRGYRMLRKIPRLSRLTIEALLARYGRLQEIIDAPMEDLADVEGMDFAKAKDVKESLSRLRELNLLERYG
ncbi:MAG: DNA integrity scanning diadenylate cyclase DisA [Actinobacteria bacterium]|nr:DNA integrity scanning diadenylate cyclase DisA [Actinomycetota bacterium]